MQTALPADVCAAIEWRELSRVDASFIDDELRHAQADLLFATTAANGKQAQLEVWARRVLTTGSLAEVLSDWF